MLKMSTAERCHGGDVVMAGTLSCRGCACVLYTVSHLSENGITLSLQYAYFTPSPTITASKNSAEHTGDVLWVQVESHLPRGSQAVAPTAEDIKNDSHVPA